MVDFVRLKEFATNERQREILDALVGHGSQREAAESLGMAQSTLNHHLSKVKRAAYIQGYSPEHNLEEPVDPGHYLKGASTLYRYQTDEGKILQWVKSDIKRDEVLELMKELIEELKSEIPPQAPIVPLSMARRDDLLNLHILTDAHIGMYAWAEETLDENWDLRIAEDTIVSKWADVLAKAPQAKTGFLLNLGDALHYDGPRPVTPTSQHIVDTDTRNQLMIRTAIRIFRRVTNMMLEYYEKVILLHAQGNHDMASSAHLQEWFSVLYEDEPRIEVIVSPHPYYTYVHGQVLLGAHHGHKRTKLKQLYDVFVEKFRQLHGNTVRSYFHTGHLHQDDHYFSHGRSKVERHETICPPDAHSSGGGWVSDMSLKCITYDHQREVGRVYAHI